MNNNATRTLDLHRFIIQPALRILRDFILLLETFQQSQSPVCFERPLLTSLYDHITKLDHLAGEPGTVTYRLQGQGTQPRRGVHEIINQQRQDQYLRRGNNLASMRQRIQETLAWLEEQAPQGAQQGGPKFYASEYMDPKCFTWCQT
jgi:hypothetical protein